MSAQRYKLQAEKGSYTLEFSLAGFILFGLIFSVLNISAYFSYWSVLSKGAHNGINLATKMPDINLPQAQFDAQVKSRITAAVTNLPVRSGLLPNAGSMQVKVFRPGDVSGSGTDEYPFPRQAGDIGTAATLMERYPIIIEVSAPFSLPIPFFGNVTVSATASGFRETAAL